MGINLVKLCVGASSIEDLQAWIDFRMDEKRSLGKEAKQTHTTRMIPKRKDELLDGGSLYWVIKNNVQCRQRLIDIHEFVDVDGIKRCDLVLKPKIIETQWQPRRAFQGWRYLDDKDAPQDLTANSLAELPIELRHELAELGLL
ncbi:DUF1489 family protein [Bartonella sp. HY406]|uniref:DUF1489 family protein n=1 Tax=Bartonella sp. HY406 TaxID=2979331 RepID=UPI0021C97E6D|nr:DUF1489 family protein [Bartonella sp. HY406]UXN04573.1 DUF1489 family protein [Bartonella sp. HY406]